MIKVEKDLHGVIWVTNHELFPVTGNRVATIEMDDTADIWRIAISKGTFTLWFNLVINETNTEEKVTQIVKDMMMFTGAGIDFQ